MQCAKHDVVMPIVRMRTYFMNAYMFAVIKTLGDVVVC